MSDGRGIPELHAVIGVWHDGSSTWYVRRSQEMENYPEVWSLLSRQYDPPLFRDPTDLDAAQDIFDEMARERLEGAPTRVLEYLTSSTQLIPDLRRRVHLDLYTVELDREPALNPRFYSDARWMLPEEYIAATVGERCGLCLRLWSDYAWMVGFTDRPFAREA